MHATPAVRWPARARGLAALALLACPACFPKFEVDSSVSISCSETADCPASFHCSSELRVCLRDGSDDTTPALVSFRLNGVGDPGASGLPVIYVGLGGQLAGEIVADEPLARAAVRICDLSLDGETVDPEAKRFTFGLSTGSGGRDGPPLGPIAPDGTCAAFVTLVDLAGNAAKEVRAATVVFDSVAPAPLGAAFESVRYLPAPGNALAEPTRAARGTTVVLGFALSEALAAPPTIWAVVPRLGGPEQRLDFGLLAKEGNSWVFRAVYGLAGDTEDEVEVSILAKDLAGNEFSGVLGKKVFVDTIPPAKPGTRNPDLQPAYVRSPWGGGGRPAEFRVRAPQGTLAGETAVVAYDGPSPASATELGRAIVTSEGAVDVPLIASDRAEVWIAAVDPAGNESPTVRVRHVEWTATLGGKVPGSLASNPTTFVTTGRLLPTLAQDPLSTTEPDALGLAALANANDGAGVVRSGEQSWRPHPAGGAGPAARSRHAAAFDPQRGRWVLFGGERGSGARLQDTWEYEPATGKWTLRSPAGARPSARSRHAMVFDSRRGRVIVFGGTGASVDPATEDLGVWEWDGEAGSWTRRAPVGASPGLRAGHAMVYDPVSEKVVLVGGRSYSGTGNSAQADVWTWDPVGGLWSELDAANDPPARSEHAVALDSGSVVLFGGRGATGMLGDTWSLDLGAPAKAWVDVTGSVPGPSARAGHAMASFGSRPVALFGGETATGEVDDAWIWEGAWRRVSTTGPSGRSGAALGRGGERGEFLLFGGESSTGAPLADTWELEMEPAPGQGATWKRRGPASAGPTPRSRHALAWLPARQQVLLVGGGSGAGPVGETWLWNPGTSAWSAEAGTSPVVSDAAVAYHAPDAAVLLFGGRGTAGLTDELWSWKDAWTKAPRSAPWPEPREGAALGSDGTVAVLFGGVTDGGDYPQDVWTWNGSAWTRHVPGAVWPEGRRGASLAGVGGSVFLFGGYRVEGGVRVYDRDVWEWKGATWTRRGPGPARSGTDVLVRSGASLFYSAARQSLILFGGEDPLPLQDLWELDPDAMRWTERTTGSVPVARAHHAMAPLDAAGATALLFGGAGDFELGDTWEWSAELAGRPAALWTVPLPQPGAQLTEVTLVASASGRGSDGPGVEALVWAPGSSTWDAPFAAVPPNQPFTLVLHGNELPDRVLGGASREIRFAIRPSSGNGASPEPAKINVDYLELRVRYVAP